MLPSALIEGGDSLRIEVALGNTYRDQARVIMPCLLDTGATAIFLPTTLCEELKLHRVELEEPFIVHTADSEVALDHEYVGLTVEYQGQKITFSVLAVGKSDILLGLPFLRRFDIFICAKDKYVASRIDFLKKYRCS